MKSASIIIAFVLVASRATDADADSTLARGRTLKGEKRKEDVSARNLRGGRRLSKNRGAKDKGGVEKSPIPAVDVQGMSMPGDRRLMSRRLPKNRGAKDKGGVEKSPIPAVDVQGMSMPGDRRLMSMPMRALAEGEMSIPERRVEEDSTFGRRQRDLEGGSMPLERRRLTEDDMSMRRLMSMPMRALTEGEMSIPERRVEEDSTFGRRQRDLEGGSMPLV